MDNLDPHLEMLVERKVNERINGCRNTEKERIKTIIIELLTTDEDIKKIIQDEALTNATIMS